MALCAPGAAPLRVLWCGSVPTPTSCTLEHCELRYNPPSQSKRLTALIDASAQGGVRALPHRDKNHVLVRQYSNSAKPSGNKAKGGKAEVPV